MPETKTYEKGEHAKINGGPMTIDPDMLMKANFGRPHHNDSHMNLNTSKQTARRRKNSIASSVSKPLNFYNDKNNLNPDDILS